MKYDIVFREEETGTVLEVYTNLTLEEVEEMVKVFNDPEVCLEIHILD